MAEFKIGRLRFVWRGVWTIGYDYVKDDVVRVGGSSYVCVTGHQSSGAFSTDAAVFFTEQHGLQQQFMKTTTLLYTVVLRILLQQRILVYQHLNQLSFQ